MQRSHRSQQSDLIRAASNDGCRRSGWVIVPQNQVSGQPRRRGERTRDLTVGPSPVVGAKDWTDAEATLVRLYERAEVFAIESANWYLRDKKRKRRACKSLRATAIILGLAGGLVPLLVASGVAVPLGVGYALLAAAAGCTAFDRYFGLSSAWMRDIQGAQAIQRTLSEFQVRWASMCRSEARTDETIQQRLSCLGELIAAVNQITSNETAAWNVEFRSTAEELFSQTTSRNNRT